MNILHRNEAFLRISKKPSGINGSDQMKECKICPFKNKPVVFVNPKEMKKNLIPLLDALKEYKNQIVISENSKPVAVLLPIDEENVNLDFFNKKEEEKESIKEKEEESIYIKYNNILNNNIQYKSKNGAKNEQKIEDAEAVLRYFNQTFKTNFKEIKYIYNKLIKKRNVIGKPISEFYTIIDNINNNTEFRDFLKRGGHLSPETLFRDRHWDKYLNMQFEKQTNVFEELEEKYGN